MTSVRIPVPEFLSSRKDIADNPNPWDVQQLHPMQGGATDIARQIMKVPFGDDAYSTAVRAHEMMHARISPPNKDACGLFPIPPHFVEAGEEFRVNTMIRRAGFDADALKSGSEKAQGVRLAEQDDWSGMVYATGVLAGTAAAADFIKGVATVDKKRAEALRALNKALVDKAKKFTNTQLADTTPSKTYNGVPRGFTRYARMFAEMLNAADQLEQKATDDEGRPVEMDAEGETVDGKKMRQALSGKGGAFAPLVLDTSIPLSRRLSGKLGRKRVATDMGRNPRRINRMLTDPHRRVFDRYTKGQGGIVLIDQSGSMGLNERDVMALLEAAPGCVIIGYSHQPGSSGVPNVWVLAERGKVVAEVRDGNGGNGVDGPAIRFAQKKRKTGEPFVWVCDGYVTDGKRDDNHQSLNDECAALVVRHDIHMVHNIGEAVSALKKCASGQRLHARAVGLVRDGVAWKGRASVAA